MDTELVAQIRQIVSESSQELRGEIQGSIEATRRHTGVLVEDLQHKLDLVVEGQEFIRQQVRNVHTDLERESQETRALLKISYQQLHQQVQHLEQRVQTIEQHLGMSA